jgi:hypothetical protein
VRPFEIERRITGVCSTGNVVSTADGLYSNKILGCLIGTCIVVLSSRSLINVSQFRHSRRECVCFVGKQVSSNNYLVLHLVLPVAVVFRGLLYNSLGPFCVDQPNNLSSWCRGFVQKNEYTGAYVTFCPKNFSSEGFT